MSADERDIPVTSTTELCMSVAHCSPGGNREGIRYVKNGSEHKSNANSDRRELRIEGKEHSVSKEGEKKELQVFEYKKE